MRKQLYWNDIPVPYVALWSSEMSRRIDIDWHSDGREALFSYGERGKGQPVWGKMHEARQRETCKLRRCQVCNCSLKSERSFAMDTPQMMRYRGQVFQVLTEPPVCARCARYAIDNCPGIGRHLQSGQMRCFEIFEYVDIGQIVGAAEGGDSDLNALLAPGQRVIGYHKCLITRADQLTEEELRRRINE
jgi:hypothetical protein